MLPNSSSSSNSRMQGTEASRQRQAPRRACRTQPIGVNDAGQTVGSYFDAAIAEHGFLSSGGTLTAIDFPEATWTAAAGINAASDIVGGWSDATGSHGFLLQAGVFTPIDVPLATSTTPSASATPGRSPASPTTPPAPPTASSTPAGPSSTVDVAGARRTFLTRIKNGDR